jgi:hypothetical protein
MDSNGNTWTNANPITTNSDSVSDANVGGQCDVGEWEQRQLVSCSVGLALRPN